MLTTWGTYKKYGDYEVVGAAEGNPRLLGEGSFGKTFQAVRSGMIAGREIRSYTAVKILNPDVLCNDGKRMQLFAEVEALSKLRHPNLVHYTDCGEQEGEVFYTMELCQGGDLGQLVRRFGPLPERAAALIGLQVAAGLRELHRRRMVHRDIKPSNIMLVEELEPALAIGDLAGRIEAHETLIRVVDFGLVNLALQDEESPNRFVGSANFASPEQIREQPVDGRSDIYSLGMTLWYLVQGSGPFMNRDGATVNDMREAFRRHLGPEEFERSFPARLSAPFRRLLARMVAKDSDCRFANAADLQQALREYLATPPEARAEFTVTRLQGPLQESYEMGKRLSSNAPFAAYAAIEKHTRAPVRLSVFAKTRGDARDEENAGRLCEMARLSRERTAPDVLLKTEAILWATDFFAATEELISFASLSDVLKARAGAKRPILFAEAALVLEPLVQALDFLLDHRQEIVCLRSEDIWLGSGGSSQEAVDLARPLTEWGPLRVRFSPLCLSPERAGADCNLADKSTGSLQLTADELHPIPAFARLVYRIVNGSDLAAVVRFTPEAYTPAVQLTGASNTLIRDLVCGQKRALNAGAVFKDLLANEAVLRAPVLVKASAPAPGAGTAAVEAIPEREALGKPAAPAGRTPALNIVAPRGVAKQRLRASKWMPAVGGMAACAALAIFAVERQRFGARPKNHSVAHAVKPTSAAIVFPAFVQSAEVSHPAAALAPATPAASTPAVATPAAELQPAITLAATPPAHPAPEGASRTATAQPSASESRPQRNYSPHNSDGGQIMRPNSAVPALGAHANIPIRQSPSSSGAMPHY